MVADYHKFNIQVGYMEIILGELHVHLHFILPVFHRGKTDKNLIMVFGSALNINLSSSATQAEAGISDLDFPFHCVFRRIYRDVAIIDRLVTVVSDP